jgi:hypothetical protein
MTKTQVEVVTSVERRSRRSRAEKERIVASAIERSAQSGLRLLLFGRGQLKWRREAASHEIRQCLEPIPFAHLPLVLAKRGLKVDGWSFQGNQLLRPWPWQRHVLRRRSIEYETLPNCLCG